MADYTPAQIRAIAAAAWDEACEAIAWCTNNGTDPIGYAIKNNPYRPLSSPVVTADD